MCSPVVFTAMGASAGTAATLSAVSTASAVTTSSNPATVRSCFMGKTSSSGYII